MPRRKITLFCTTEQAWKEVKTSGGFTHTCPEDPSHVVQSVIDKGAVQDSEVLQHLTMVNMSTHVRFDNRAWENGDKGNIVYFPGTVSLQATPRSVKLLLGGKAAGKATSMQLRTYYTDTVLAEWTGDLYGNYTPQIVTLDVGAHASSWPTAETILSLWMATPHDVRVYSMALL
jgi:hypothetical protein